MTPGNLITVLATCPSLHARSTPFYEAMNWSFESWRQRGHTQFEFGPFGTIKLPFQKMGSVTTVNCFDMDELIIYSLYWSQRHRYRKVIDLGANLGLHSILMRRCGFQVTSYEPDPTHLDILKTNLQLNEINNVEVHACAVSDNTGEEEFVRVCGNTTSSHLKGSKIPYGPTETFRVPVLHFGDLPRADLIKVDIEGAEARALCTTNESFWQYTDAVVEVGNENTARRIFDHMNKIKASIYSQKTGWSRVYDYCEMPTSYKEGSIFISNRWPPFGGEAHGADYADFDDEVPDIDPETHDPVTWGNRT